MTNREEAILGLKELRDWEGLPYCIEEPMQREGVVVITQEVIDMAIQALEQQSTNAVILNATNEGRWREEEEYSYGLKSKRIWWDDGIVAESEDEA